MAEVKDKLVTVESMKYLQDKMKGETASLKGEKGDKGDTGAAGHSPVVTATKSGGVTTVKVDGKAIATINDGAKGADGKNGKTPARGTDYWTEADKAAIVADVIAAHSLITPEQ